MLSPSLSLASSSRSWLYHNTAGYSLFFLGREGTIKERPSIMECIRSWRRRRRWGLARETVLYLLTLHIQMRLLSSSIRRLCSHGEARGQCQHGKSNNLAASCYPRPVVSGARAEQHPQDILHTWRAVIVVHYEVWICEEYNMWFCKDLWYQYGSAMAIVAHCS